MSASDTVLFALRKHFRRELDPTIPAVDCLAEYDAERRVEAFDEGIRALRKWFHKPGVSFAVGVLLSVRDDRDPDTADRAGFFQPGHTYRHGDWDFRCASVATHPATGKPTAIGWIRFPDRAWQIYEYSEAEWGCDWTDITNITEGAA